MSSRHPEPLPGASGHTDYRRQTAKGQTRSTESIRVTDPPTPTIATVLDVFAVIGLLASGLFAVLAEVPGEQKLFLVSILMASSISLFGWSAIIKATASTSHYAKITAHLLASRDK